MARVRLSRKFIKDAIRAELPMLRDGSWAEIGYATDADGVVAPQCFVCAVGAVMKHAVRPARRDVWATWTRIRRAATAATFGDDQVMPGDRSISDQLAWSRARSLVKRGHPLNGLSYLFEALYLRYDGRSSALCDRLFALVDTFPPTIVVDIDGVHPARDVTVVRARRKQA